MATKRGRVKKTRRSKTPIWRRKYSELSVRHRHKRRQSLEVLSRMRRKGFSLTRASRSLGISKRTVRRHVGSALSRRGRGWVLSGRDRVSRIMRIYERGQEIPIEVADYQAASTIGRYHSIVGRFLDSGKRARYSILVEVVQLLSQMERIKPIVTFKRAHPVDGEANIQKSISYIARGYKEIKEVLISGHCHSKPRDVNIRLTHRVLTPSMTNQ